MKVIDEDYLNRGINIEPDFTRGKERDDSIRG